MQIPECINFVRKLGCEKSDVVVKEEKDDCFVLFCRCCELVSVVSKDGVIDKSKFESNLKRQKEAEALDYLWRKRRKIFA